MSNNQEAYQTKNYIYSQVKHDEKPEENLLKNIKLIKIDDIPSNAQNICPNQQIIQKEKKELFKDELNIIESCCKSTLQNDNLTFNSADSKNEDLINISNDASVKNMDLPSMKNNQIMFGANNGTFSMANINSNSSRSILMGNNLQNNSSLSNNALENCSLAEGTCGTCNIGTGNKINSTLQNNNVVPGNIKQVGKTSSGKNLININGAMASNSLPLNSANNINTMSQSNLLNNNNNLNSSLNNLISSQSANPNNTSMLSNSNNSSSGLSKKAKHKKPAQKGMKDFAFKFPLENSFSKVEIPFAFQQNKEENQRNDRFHSYITIKDTPKLYLDISNEEKTDKFLLSSTIESLKTSNLQQENKLQGIDNNIMQIKNENDAIREEIEKLKNELTLRNQTIANLKQMVQQINNSSTKIANEMNIKINEKSSTYSHLKEKYDEIDKDFKLKSLEEKQKYIMNFKNEIRLIEKDYLNSFKFYLIKFQNNYHDEEFITKYLQNDLLDFSFLVQKKINQILPKVQQTISSIQNSVKKCLGDNFNIQLYGSHATGLCLPWSDLDVVLCKNINESLNSYLPLHELFKYLQENQHFKSINYIGATTVPLIKIKMDDTGGISSLDISLQDKGHYGLKCVNLVRSYKEQYEALQPMVLALKNILKEANLNDPYKVSYNFIIHFYKFIGRP